MRGLRILPRAERDLDEIADHIARDSIHAALRLYRSAESTFERLRRTPEIGAKYEPRSPRLRRLRVWPLSDFAKILVFYVPSPSHVTVIRVLHGARDLPTALTG
ncbi:MAG TPA: type II toxin-antitoxin system RelE/ParE family toxin [bacterium]|nr:type II toxin-antitoxin system RelE/ParE family toxin [bacterium]